MNLDLWDTLWLSIRISVVATGLALLVAMPLAYLNVRFSYRGKSFLEGLIIVPLVLPPTVVGYLIIAGLGARGWLGQYMMQWFSYSIMFRFEGAVLAAAVVALPLIYLPTRAAFASIEREMEDTALLMGANRWQQFYHITLPLSGRGVTSGLMLAFARAMGEFGATVIVFGIREGHTTLPVSIYLDYEHGEMHRAAPAVALLCMLSMTLTVLYNRSAMSRQE